MKKRLEAELISIAHRVLKLKNKSEVDQLFSETQKLYEALSVLKFYGDHIEVKATISEEELEEKLADSFENKPEKEKAPEPLKQEVSVAEDPSNSELAQQSEVAETKEIVVEQEVDEKAITSEEAAVDEEHTPADPSDSELAEQTKIVAVGHDLEEEKEEEPIIVGEINIEEDEEVEEEVTAEETGSDPIFEMASEEIKEEVPSDKSKPQQISFEHLLGEDYKEPEFVKPNDISSPVPQAEKEEEHTEVLIDKKKEEKTSNLNEKFATGINIGLNDRIGFVKYLFDNSTEDYNRVLSQLNTFSTFGDAKEFIDEMVKPDYNNWVGQEDFAERFMEIVEKKFA